MKYLFVLVISFTLSFHAFSQGCSDAGFCSIGSMKTNSIDSVKSEKHKTSVLFSNGIGDNGVIVITPAIQYEYMGKSNWMHQFKLTGNYASGNLGNTYGAGDLFISSTYHSDSTKRVKSFFTFGAKLPLNSGDIRINNKGLPMQYQSSLGTLDLILGYGLKIKKLSINAAWQNPLSGPNKNSFLPRDYNNSTAMKYPPSNSFNRKGDVLLRLAYQLLLKPKFNWNTSLLAIYHLGQDTYVDSALSPSPIKIAGSEGLTLNLTSMISYKINKRLRFVLSGGAPIIVRKIRPDGLTRAFSVSPEINFIF